MVRGLGPNPTAKDFQRLITDKRGDFDLLELVTILNKLCALPGNKLQELKKTHPDILKQIAQSLKDNLAEQLDNEPFISDEYANKMNSLSPEEYEAFLQESIDNPDPQATNYERKFPRIGEIARCLAVLRVNDFDVWDLILKYFEKDRYRTTMPETLSALEGIGFFFHVIHKTQQPDQLQLPPRLHSIANKFETIIFKTVWYENIETFGRIYRSLHLLGKFDNKPLFDKVEFYLMNTLDSNYTADQFIDIAHLIVKSGHGGRELFINLQRIAAYGHFTQQTNPLWTMLKKHDPFTLTATNLSKLSEIYQTAKLKCPGPPGAPNSIELIPDFRIGYFKSVQKFCALPQTDVSLQQLETLFLGASSFELETDEIHELHSDLAKKTLQVVEGSVDLETLALFTRNIAEAFFTRTQLNSYAAIVTNKLVRLKDNPSTSGLVGTNAVGLSAFANMYSRSAIADQKGLDALAHVLDKHLKDNKYRLRPGDEAALKQLAEQSRTEARALAAVGPSAIGEHKPR